MFGLAGSFQSAAQPVSALCDPMGWRPDGYGLKDHHVFYYQGYYYLIGNHIPGEKWFAYGRSQDLCNWEDLGAVLGTRIPGSVDELAIWAPFVYEEQGVYYLYYTGVTHDYTQRILMATSDNPADPSAWTPRGAVFQPDHEHMVWMDGEWADCRDPTMARFGEDYYLYYTASDLDGGIVGVATAKSPIGPWIDHGRAAPPIEIGMLESATVLENKQVYYLFYHNTVAGEQYRSGVSPIGPWFPVETFQPGWAHELWLSEAGEWYTSYLTDYSVTIKPVVWDENFSPPHPKVSANNYQVFLSLLTKFSAGAGD